MQANTTDTTKNRSGKVDKEKSAEKSDLNQKNNKIIQFKRTQNSDFTLKMRQQNGKIAKSQRNLYANKHRQDLVGSPLANNKHRIDNQNKPSNREDDSVDLSQFRPGSQMGGDGVSSYHDIKVLEATSDASLNKKRFLNRNLRK